MKKLVAFRAIGLAPVPWSTPDIGVVRKGDGRQWRFARGKKKSQLALGKASLADWQAHVAAAAREAWGEGAPVTCPVKVHMEFLAKTPKGCWHGQLWTVEVALVVPDPAEGDKAALSSTKRSLRGRPEPDLCNLFKGTEDALQNIIYANDVQTRIMSAAAFFGPYDGVRVTVYTVEPDDFPGGSD